jgi:hypothetical protein
MKVIEPLFLNDLYDEFEKNKYKPKKLHQLLERLSKIKIFDPACGSGNFLIIAYKQLRYFEIKLLKQLQKIQNVATTLDSPQKELIPKSQLSLAASHQLPLFSRIQLSQFYGIEIDDFAHEVATLSLWLAEHQMNLTFKEQFGKSEPSLPLKDSGNIKQGNATRLDWENVCKNEEGSEIFVLGNPPYLGSRNQEKKHKQDLAHVFSEVKNYKKLDYISAWFYKVSKYINGEETIKSAFVSTNSVSQGEQVSLLWPPVLKNEVEIIFAVQSFKWSNNAKNNAGVTVVIIGLGKNPNEKRIYSNDYFKEASNISPYLTNSSDLIVSKRTKPLSRFPKMTYGNYTGGCNELLLTEKEKEKLIKDYPKVEKYIRPLVGSNELLNAQNRFCIWIKDEQLAGAHKIDIIKEKIKKVEENRLASKDPNLNKLASRSHQFRDLTEANKQSIVIPIVSSERRDYIPCGFLPSEVIIPNSAQAIYDPKTFIFGILSSYMHALWIKTVCGSLESRIRYSSTLGYNTFPFPKLSIQSKERIDNSIYRILEEREKNSEKTIAQLYDPDKMPKGLRDAHKANDRAIEQCYRSEPFKSDEERLEVLFELYEKMIAEEEN